MKTDEWGELIYDEQRQGYWRKTAINDHSSVSTSHMEQTPRYESMGTHETPALDLPCVLMFTSFRTRPSDVDGLSTKYVIDGLVHAGILPNDSEDIVKEVRKRQEHSTHECTIIHIY